jgi:hypothetical protein
MFTKTQNKRRMLLFGFIGLFCSLMMSSAFAALESNDYILEQGEATAAGNHAESQDYSLTGSLQVVHSELIPTPICGNNFVEPGEACDGTAVTCKSLGYDSGQIQCLNNCRTLITEACINYSGGSRRSGGGGGGTSGSANSDSSNQTSTETNDNSEQPDRQTDQQDAAENESPQQQTPKPSNTEADQPSSQNQETPNQADEVPSPQRETGNNQNRANAPTQNEVAANQPNRTDEDQTAQQQQRESMAERLRQKREKEQMIFQHLGIPSSESVREELIDADQPTTSPEPDADQRDVFMIFKEDELLSRETRIRLFERIRQRLIERLLEQQAYERAQEIEKRTASKARFFAPPVLTGTLKNTNPHHFVIIKDGRIVHQRSIAPDENNRYRLLQEDVDLPNGIYEYKIIEYAGDETQAVWKQVFEIENTETPLEITNANKISVADEEEESITIIGNQLAGRTVPNTALNIRLTIIGDTDANSRMASIFGANNEYNVQTTSNNDGDFMVELPKALLRTALSAEITGTTNTIVQNVIVEQQFTQRFILHLLPMGTPTYYQMISADTSDEIKSFYILISITLSLGIICFMFFRRKNYWHWK